MRDLKSIKIHITLTTILFSFILILFFVLGIVYKEKTNESSYTTPNGVLINPNSEKIVKNFFPDGLIPEEDVYREKEAYTAISKDSKKVQYTYRYLSLQSVAKSMAHFDSFTKSDGWKQISPTGSGDKFLKFYSVSASKEGVFITVNINYLADTLTDVEISMVK